MQAKPQSGGRLRQGTSREMLPLISYQLFTFRLPFSHSRHSQFCYSFL